jgi:hypothetical protein
MLIFFFFFFRDFARSLYSIVKTGLSVQFNSSYEPVNTSIGKKESNEALRLN